MPPGQPQGDQCAEGDADHVGRAVFQQRGQVVGHGVERGRARRIRRIAVAAQVGGDQREVAGQPGELPVPRRGGGTDAVEQEQYRAGAGPQRVKRRLGRFGVRHPGTAIRAPSVSYTKQVFKCELVMLYSA